MPLRALADQLAAALTSARHPGPGDPRREQLTSALELAFPRAASCSLEVVVGRKVFIATAACSGVSQQLIQIRSRDEAREATLPGLLGAFGDVLRVSVPLAAKPGRWRPMKRQSADRWSDMSYTSATVYLQLKAPHTSFTPQDECVLEGLAALLGLQLRPLMPMLKRNSRRGAKEGGADNGEAPTNATGGNSLADKAKRRSSEFVISMARKSNTFLRLISLSSEGGDSSMPSRVSSTEDAAKQRRKSDIARPPLTAGESIPEGWPLHSAPPILRPAPASSAGHLDSSLFAPSWPPREVTLKPDISDGGSGSGRSGYSGQNLFAEAPHRLGPSVSGPPGARPSAVAPLPALPTPTWAPAAAAPEPANPFGAPPQAAKQEPPNPFARQGYNDWDTLGGPREFAGDGYDSDTTDFVSWAFRLPLDRERAKLFATDDHVWLPGDMEWDGRQLRRRIGAAFANGYNFAMGAGGPPQSLGSDALYPADSANVMPFGGAVQLQSFEPDPYPPMPPRNHGGTSVRDTVHGRGSPEQIARPATPPPQRMRRRATPEALDRLRVLSDQHMSSDDGDSKYSTMTPRRGSSSAPGAAMTAQHPPRPPTQPERRASNGVVHDSASSSTSNEDCSPSPAWPSPHHWRLGLSSFLLSAISAWLLYCFSHPESRYI